MVADEVLGATGEVGELRGGNINPQPLVERVEDVAEMSRRAGIRLLAPARGRAEDLAVPQTAAGQEGTADVRPVVAAGVGVDLRRAAELASRDDGDVIVYMDVDRLMASPLAAKEDWKGKRSADYASRPMAVPPSVTKLVRAASVNLDVDETAWQIAVLEAKSVPSLETIAKNEKGYLDTVAGTKAVWSPRGAYAFKVSDNALGLVFPANRQYLARWVKEKPDQFSSYLLDASQVMTASGPQLVVVLDLEDLVQPQAIPERLKGMESLKNAKVNTGDLAKTLAGIKGVKFAVTVKEKATGKVTVDFSGDAAVLKDVGKGLLLEVLENRGLTLEDLDAW